jgi:hypothetical protein
LFKFYANAGGKRPIQRQPLLVKFNQQANPLLSKNNYTPLEITVAGMTFLSQALTARNTLFAL